MPSEPKRIDSMEMRSFLKMIRKGASGAMEDAEIDEDTYVKTRIPYIDFEITGVFKPVTVDGKEEIHYDPWEGKGADRSKITIRVVYMDTKEKEDNVPE